jgi:hypothetical protein
MRQIQNVIGCLFCLLMGLYLILRPKNVIEGTIKSWQWWTGFLQSHWGVWWVIGIGIVFATIGLLTLVGVILELMR